MSNPCIAIGYISHTLTLVNLWYSKDIDTLGKLPSLCNITTNSATSLVPFTQWWSPTCFNNLQCQSPGKRIPVVTTYTTIFPMHQCHSLLCIPIMPLNHRSTTPITFPLQPHNYTARTECTHLSLSGYWPAPWNLFQNQSTWVLSSPFLTTSSMLNLTPTQAIVHNENLPTLS